MSQQQPDQQPRFSRMVEDRVQQIIKQFSALQQLVNAHPEQYTETLQAHVFDCIKANNELLSNFAKLRRNVQPTILAFKAPVVE